MTPLQPFGSPSVARWIEDVPLPENLWGLQVFEPENLYAGVSMFWEILFIWRQQLIAINMCKNQECDNSAAA